MKQWMNENKTYFGWIDQDGVLELSLDTKLKLLRINNG